MPIVLLMERSPGRGPNRQSSAWRKASPTGTSRVHFFEHSAAQRHRLQRMPARCKEVVVNADLRNTEYFRPKVGMWGSPSRKNLPPAARTTIFNPNPYLQIEAVRKGIQRKMTAYYAYHAELLNTEKIMADIHFIGSEHVQPLPE